MSRVTILASKALVGALGVVYTVFSVISPGEERKKELIQNFPEANPVRMEDTRRRNALVMQSLKDAAEDSDLDRAFEVARNGPWVCRKGHQK
ncbi:ubiquinol-cytochrome-c reductase complex assembly factor 3-like [Oncorhynchus nerka]|uniref:ubiquinol-cytochrome-c reductase complex assembly factor 3-like n=1 Tax=Oncorhynchus nerka TaxID=8023 RepID=UPI0011326FD2|nr:ubiquinol-cytochrome-c reductase complex assembly factor 3-like [Oncorhynchus nerka]